MAILGHSLVAVVVLFLVSGCGSDRPAPTSTRTIGPSLVRESDGAAMVYVPAGEFEMGSTNGDEDERPVHTVVLDGFWIDRYEVTNAKFRQCVNADACQPPTVCEWGKPTFERASEEDHPVVCVDWHGANAYCRWAGGRLPTEAEWEYAARSPHGWFYPWGDVFDCSRGNFDDETQIHDYVVPGGQGCDDHALTAPVGYYETGASWIGAFDMAGNVWEWVADWYGSYSSAEQANPTGPESGVFRVLRGGAWISFRESVRSAQRHRDIPGSRNRHGGFRCAASATSFP
jgi:serine/threonine-protein kinase